jgi:serine protease Do
MRQPHDKEGVCMEEKEPYSFIKETIKDRPINKKKFFRKTMTTVCSAVIFGGIACLTFLLLEPVISNWLTPEEITKVEFPEEEISPEELLTEESALEEQEQINEQIDQQIKEEASDGQLALQTYQTIYEELYQISAEASKSIVIVTGISSETDWFHNYVESINETSGVIVAKNETQLYILADSNGLPDAETYRVEFANSEIVEAQLKRRDPNTGLAIFTVSDNYFSKETWEEIEVAKLGHSNLPSIVGRPVIAVGSPLGQSGSICYGIITSNQKDITYADYNYSVLTTDMSGSEKNASGIIMNTSGQVLGIITQESSASTSGALLTCFGISDIKELIEQLSNGDKRFYLGIYGAAVSDEIHEELGIPYGIYVTEVDAGSPAMTSGVSNGDVIVKLGDVEIQNDTDYQNALKTLRTDVTATIQLKRYNGENYVNIESEIRPEELKE